MELTRALDRLAATWARLGMPIASHLQPGLTEGEIRSRYAEVGLVPNDTVLELYQWHNGTDQDRSASGLNSVFMSVDGSIEVYSRIFRIFDWGRGWVPVFSDSSGFVVVDCRDDRAEADRYGDVAYQPHLEAMRSAECRQTLARVMAWWDEKFTKGYWGWSEEHGAFLSDDDVQTDEMKRSELA